MALIFEHSGTAEGNIQTAMSRGVLETGAPGPRPSTIPGCSAPEDAHREYAIASHEKATRMFKALLISVVIVPVLLAIVAATSRRERAGLTLVDRPSSSLQPPLHVPLYYLRRRWVG